MYFWQHFPLFLVKYILHDWGDFFYQKNPLQNRVFGTLKDVKSTGRCFLENPTHTNPNIPSNLYWAKIWWILHKERSQCTWNSFTCSTELKSSSPLHSSHYSYIADKDGIQKKMDMRHCKLVHRSQSQNCATFPSHIWSILWII